VVEVLALEVDVRGAVELGETLGEVQGVSAADVILEDGFELGLREKKREREGGSGWKDRQRLARGDGSG